MNMIIVMIYIRSVHERSMCISMNTIITIHVFLCVCDGNY